ncbi:membrane protein [Desulfuromonas versatilis]|uniref:Membrane protein n=1 Tax=Desulfuromonas versatilis TaxID=2802975 RepID=A0ABM8HW83_9BACT|nr:OmpA family protein [Desulfuromonas versatilis]BCR05018.1 membrane protein [Desulfuromonas versatilis]
MRRSILVLAMLAALSLGRATPSYALTPTQFGNIGLLSQPTADTLNAGNIGLGLWGNFSEKGKSNIVPVSLTMGLGSFMEVYGSYPNLLFNDDDLDSGRGYANIGAKFRVWGKRSSLFKMALDAQVRRTLSDSPDFDGLTDLVGRVIGSYKPLERFGIHVNAGYVKAEDPDNIDFEDQYIFAGGVEFFPSMRLRLIAELETLTERVDGGGKPTEATAGFQYFISPHLTVNLGLGMGLSDVSPDWRVLVGLSGSQGVGTYRRSIPKIIEPAPEEPEAVSEPIKIVKIRTLTPLIPTAAVKTSPVAKLEVPIEPNTEEVVVMPVEKLVIPEAAAGGALAVAPIAPPEVSPAPASRAAAPVAATQEVGATKAPEEPIRTVVYRKFRLPELTFSFDQWSLSDEGKKTLSLIANHLRQEGKWLILRIDGHTDNVGSDLYNDRLSLKRAISAATHLVARDGFDANRIFVRGFGESTPIADNATEEGRAENRRLEILVLVPREGGH